MALTTCKECGLRVSDKANVCPHCGARLKDILHQQLGLGGCLMVIVLLIIGGMAVSYFVPYAFLE